MGQVVINGIEQAPAVHAGVNAGVFTLSLSAASSAGDTIVFGRLPHGAVILDATCTGLSGYNGTHAPQIGLSATASLLFASVTYSTLIRTVKTGHLGYQVSLSDDAMPRYANVIATCSTAITAGSILRLVVLYKMPPA